MQRICVSEPPFACDWPMACPGTIPPDPSFSTLPKISIVGREFDRRARNSETGPPASARDNQN
jgi:hypothetical protein